RNKALQQTGPPHTAQRGHAFSEGGPAAELGRYAAWRRALRWAPPNSTGMLHGTTQRRQLVFAVIKSWRAERDLSNLMWRNGIAMAVASIPAGQSEFASDDILAVPR